ncbi:tetratricopeptide repeat protein [Myroides odoratimimus]|uniref:tetratricopeptide repeat protein n=1 Tax=Myroides odoratimimus TaxID=76832 RepID=UPI0009126C1E|nr:tetratricopeptide repeat protein [Myroides odoratimimus]SHL24296.1 Tetratricopeptide repeat-containing protein [Myroides odoratimimus subsp. xuanwuensis]
MKSIITTLLLGGAVFSTFGQDSVEVGLKALTDQDKYKEITEIYINDIDKLSAKSLYYIGNAYYMLENDQECLKYINLSIEKDNSNSASYFLKGNTLNYTERYTDAIEAFNQAIKLNPNDALFYSGLGDSYNQLKQYQQALDAFSNATKMENCPIRSFYMLGQLCMDLNMNSEALKAYYVTKSKIDFQSEYYVNILFNIGLLELLANNYKKAEPIFEEIIKISPTDFHSYAKLIQVYYHNKQYEKAEPLKAVLYKAFKQGELVDTDLEDMFCIDQFSWNNKKIMTFERYEEGDKNMIYYKHIFYLLDDNGDVEIQVQTEYSPFAAQTGDVKYLLCASKGSTHYNSGIGLKKGYTYQYAKILAIQMFEKHMK